MVAATYEICFDADRTGPCSGGADDITPYVLAASWSIGMAASYDNVSPPAKLTLTLDNRDGRFSVQNPASPLYGLLVRGSAVEINVNVGGTDARLYTGIVINFSPDPGVLGSKTVTLTCVCPMEQLLAKQYIPPLLTDVTTDEPLTTMFESGIFAYPYPGSFWMVGVAGSGELDTTTVLFENLVTDFETGNTTLPYVGDNFDRGQGVTVNQYVHDIVAAEAGGRFYWNPADTGGGNEYGQFNFVNRQHDILNTALDDTVTSADFERCDLRYFSDLVNTFRLTFEPRVLGTPNSTMWQYGQVPRLMRPNEEFTLTARYQDPTDTKARVGGIDMIPMRKSDWSANENEDGSGASVRTRMLATAELGASSAVVTVVNETSTSYYLTSLRLRGTPLTTYERQTVIATDPASIRLYGEVEKPLTILSISDEEFAQQYADWMLMKFSMPVPRVASLTFNANASSARLTRMRARMLGDRVRLIIADEDHDAEYIIVGFRHDVKPGGDHEHNVTWILLPADKVNYWLLGTAGFSELDETTRPML